MNVQLIGVGLRESDLQIDVMALPMVVGRATDAGVRLFDSWVSRCHCKLDELNGKLLVRDLGSKYGTYVNGLKIEESHVLPGDRLTFGISTFRVEYQRGTRTYEGSTIGRSLSQTA